MVRRSLLLPFAEAICNGSEARSKRNARIAESWRELPMSYPAIFQRNGYCDLSRSIPLINAARSEPNESESDRYPALPPADFVSLAAFVRAAMLLAERAGQVGFVHLEIIFEYNKRLLSNNRGKA